MDLEEVIKFYTPDINRSAHFYKGFWSSQRWKAGINDLKQMGRIAIWKISQRDPEKLLVEEYVRAAIRYEMVGQVRPRKNFERQIYVAGSDEGEEVPVIDLMPAKDSGYERELDAQDLLHTVATTHSEEAARSVEGLLKKCNVPLLDVGLSGGVGEDSVERVRLVTGMDLSDDDMVVYARVLTGDLFKFPQRFLQERGKEKSRKYLRHALKLLGVSPGEFVKKPFPRREVVSRFRLTGLWQYVHGRNYGDMILGAFPGLKPYRARLSGKWTGNEGLVNAYDAITDLVVKVKKEPVDLRLEDFQRFGLHRMLRDIFNGSHIVATEFAFPGTFDHSYNGLEGKVTPLWEGLEEALEDDQLILGS